jgi:hypothetical protein
MAYRILTRRRPNSLRYANSANYSINRGIACDLYEKESFTSSDPSTFPSRTVHRSQLACRHSGYGIFYIGQSSGDLELNVVVEMLVLFC